MRFRGVFILMGLLGAGVALTVLLRSWMDPQPSLAALKVEPHDHEIAWLHTSTSNAAWERFVTGAKLARRLIPDLVVNDGDAFPAQSTVIPQLIIGREGSSERILIRWYKLTESANVWDWVRALSARDPAPLAIIGGDTSDRARDLARALAAQTEWHGDRPLLFITTATVDDLRPENDPDRPSEAKLMQIYAGRSFRFCFSNFQMAKALTDFVWSRVDLRPRGVVDLTLRDVTQNLGLLPLMASNPWYDLANQIAVRPVEQGKCFVLDWKDDPYSSDLSSAFYDQIQGAELTSFHLDYSVGSFAQANREERKRVDQILEKIAAFPGGKSMLVLPTTVRSARRIVRGMVRTSPLIGRELVVVTGDSISFNTVYRDSSIMWNTGDLPVPLIFFAHQNPVAWEDELIPPNGTDDVLLIEEMIRVLVEGAYRKGAGTLTNATELAERLRERTTAPQFDAEGNREGGGEYIVMLEPQITSDGRILPSARLNVWRRAPDGWVMVLPSPLFVPPTQDARKNEARGGMLRGQ